MVVLAPLPFGMVYAMFQALFSAGFFALATAYCGVKGANRNNFATYMGLGLLCAAGFYAAGVIRALDSRRTGRDRTLHLAQQAFVKGAPLLACILVLMTALFLSHSRGGVTCSIVALIVLLVVLGMMGRRVNRMRRLASVSVLAALLGVFS